MSFEAKSITKPKKITPDSHHPGQKLEWTNYQCCNETSFARQDNSPIP